MQFGGGPVNNYVLQATCQMAELLREDRANNKPAKGLVTSVSGMLTKQGFGLWSNEASTKGFELADVTAQAQAESAVIELVNGINGVGKIVGYTVLFADDEPSRAVVVRDLKEGSRTVAYSTDAAVMDRMMSEELCGTVVDITSSNVFSFA